MGIVIPALDEAARLPSLLSDLAQLTAADVVVVDGGSADETPRVAAAAGARVVRAPRGRSSQMNAGARAVRGEWLCFLHADARLDQAARRDLAATVADDGAQAAVWRLAIDAPGAWFRLVEWGAHQRARVGGLAYGDQGLLVRRTLFERVGGFPEIPIMEDVALFRSLRRVAPIRHLTSVVTVSARRWRREGPVRAWARNVVLISAYLAGTSPHRLARWYPVEPR